MSSAVIVAPPLWQRKIPGARRDNRPPFRAGTSIRGKCRLLRRAGGRDARMPAFTGLTGD